MAPARILALLLLAACQPISIAGPDTGVEPEIVDDSAPADDSAPPEDSGEVVPSALPAIFNDAVLHRIDISLTSIGVAALDEEPYEWVPADVVIDGEAVDNIGLRLRGKIGSFRTMSGKPKFKLDFKEFESDQRFQGLKHLSLNNSVVDCSYLRETAGYALFREAGYPASLASYAQVYVNGEPYGLYVVVEVPDDKFLDRNFEESGGNLYDGKYLWYGGWNYAMADFTPEAEDNFELEEGEDVGGADLHNITLAAREDGSFEDRFGEFIDLEQLHRFMLLEQWIGHLDGYTLNTNNYRVYFRPEDGKAILIHWDLDYAFLTARSWGFSWSRPEGVVAQICWDDDACRDEQAAVLATLNPDMQAVLTRIDGYRELIEDAALDDPRRECQSYEVSPDQDSIIAWLEGSKARLEGAW